MVRHVEKSREGLSDAEISHSLLGQFVDMDFSKYVLVPGDPERVSIMASQWDEAKEYPLTRGLKCAIGVYKGTKITALSSGIGGPSLEHVLTEMAALGVHTFIRVGTTGALQKEIHNGDLIVNEASVRMDGTSHLYVRDEFPAAASYEVTLALIEACETHDIPYHVGIGATTASFYRGQGRTSFGGYKPSGTEEILTDMQQAGVLNFEMEAAALLTLSRLFRVRAGVICSVIAQRVTGIWDDAGGVERGCRVGAEAVRILTEWDEKKARAGKKFFFPGLLS